MAKLTRRELGAVLSASAALMAQNPNPPIPSNPDEELKAAKEALAQNSQQLAKFEIPMSTEPATHFKA